MRPELPRKVASEAIDQDDAPAPVGALQKAPVVIDNDRAAVIEVITLHPDILGIDMDTVHLQAIGLQTACDDARPEADDQDGSGLHGIEPPEPHQSLIKQVGKFPRLQVDPSWSKLLTIMKR